MAAEKSRVTAEEERDAALKKAEKLAKAAETAEFESSDYRTQITYLPSIRLPEVY